MADITPFYISIGCQGVFIVLLAVCLCTGWFGGSQECSKEKKILNKCQILKIRAVLGKRRVQLKELATNVVIERLKDGILHLLLSTNLISNILLKDLQNITKRQKLLKGIFLSI